MTISLTYHDLCVRYSRGDCRDRDLGPSDWRGSEIITLLEMFSGASGFAVDNGSPEILVFGPIV